MAGSFRELRDAQVAGPRTATRANTGEHVYYPSCVVNLSIVFDEELLASVTPGTPMSTDQAAAQVPGSHAPRDSVPRVLAASSVNDAPHGGRGAAQKGADPVHLLNRVPKKCTVEMPSTRQAATFDLTFDFKELPIDPRTVRAIGVEVHMGVVSPADFADGMRHAGPHGVRRSILQTRDDKNSPNTKTLLMVGIGDEWDVEYGTDGAEVSIKGRDLRGLLLDSPLSLREINKLDLSRPLDGVIADLLFMHPAGERIEIVFNAAEWPNGRIPYALPSDAVPRHRRGARGSRRGGFAAPPGGGEMTYWDAIVRLCFLVGAIPYFSGRQLHLRPALGYFEQRGNGLDPVTRTPFNPNAARQLPGHPAWAVRRMIYGNNLSSIKFSRKFGGSQKPKQVRCISADLSSPDRANARHIEARWPISPPTPRQQAASQSPPRTPVRPPPPGAPLSRQVEAALRNRVAPSAQQSQTEVINIPVYGIRDVERLRGIAMALFNEIGRNEMGGTFETKDLSSFGAGNEDPDLLRLRPGDAVEFYFDGSLAGAGATNDPANHFRRPFSEVLQETTRRLGSEQLARAILATSRGSINRIQNFFRVSSVHYTFEGSGIGVSVEFQNYFVIRNDLLGAQTTDLLAGRGPTDQRPAQRTVVRDHPRVPRPPVHNASVNPSSLPPEEQQALAETQALQRRNRR